MQGGRGEVAAVARGCSHLLWWQWYPGHQRQCHKVSIIRLYVQMCVAILPGLNGGSSRLLLRAAHAARVCSSAPDWKALSPN